MSEEAAFSQIKPNGTSIVSDPPGREFALRFDTADSCLSLYRNRTLSQVQQLN